MKSLTLVILLFVATYANAQINLDSLKIEL